MRCFHVALLLIVMMCPVNCCSQGTADCRQPDRYDGYTLALTWQPGFCEHVRGSDRKPECVAMATGRLTINHLTLHGLWPNSRSCGLEYGHCPGPPLRLRRQTIDALKPWMPSWYFSSDFGAYQWRKHGVCQTRLEDDDYFRKAIDAVRTVNDSEAGQYLRQHVGGAISKRLFLNKITEEVGNARAADNVLLLCEKNYLSEIRVLVGPNFKENQGMATMFQEALTEKIEKNTRECRRDQIRIERSGL